MTIEQTIKEALKKMIEAEEVPAWALAELPQIIDELAPSEADLRKADLRGADLGGANLRGADLRWAKDDATTTWPAGFEPDLCSCASPGR